MSDVLTPRTGTERGTAATRKTFLIADVRGYTRFTRERGDEAAAILAKRFADLARDAVEARSGLVIELRGDEALAVFDDPAQAVRAAVEFQETCQEESQADPSFPLPVGIGIDAGDAVPVEDGYRGVALNMAARLCSGAGAGQVLVTRAIVEQGGPLDGDVRFIERGPASFKGFESAVDVIEAIASVGTTAVDAALAGGAGVPPELDPLTPLVDREHELRWLRGTWRQVRRGRGRLLFVTGPAQIGKTRLASEIAAHVDREGGSVVYAGPGGAATAAALSALRDAVGAATPTLLVLDDVDIAGAPVGEALRDAYELIATTPLLVLGLARDPSTLPELAAIVERADAGGDGRRTLPPLDATGVRGIVELYVGEDAMEVPVEAMARASGGVPGRVHEVVSDWARSEASRRLEAAAEFLAAGRGRHAGDLEFANNVIGLKLGRLFTVGGRDVAPVDVCPYKGLAPFDEDDSAYFFGRERLVGELAARTVQAGLLGVVGASGSGKSSVVSAGLLPSLRAGLLPGSERWRQASMRPGEHPMREFHAAIGEADSGDERLVLVIDQFEETFTTCGDEDERAAFVDAITSAATHPDRIAIVLTIRGDYYGHCAQFPALADAIAANHVLVGPLTHDELRRAIELPARRAGLRVESSLVDALVEEVADEPGSLPMLSTALVELWQLRDEGWIRMAAHERTGGVRGAVARLAETSYAELSDAQQGAARRLFLRLVAVGDGEAATKRRADLEELDLESDPTLAATITKLTQDRLLTMTDNTVEVAHEALLREWPRFQGWLEDDAQGRQVRQHLTQVSRQWDVGGRESSELYRGARLSATLDWSAGHAAELNELERQFLAASRQASEQEAAKQRRTNRRLRGLLVGTAVFLVVALLAGSLALIQRGSARRSARNAERSAIEAEAQRLGATSLVTKTPQLSLLLARQAVTLSDTTQTRSTLLAALLRWQGVVRVIRPNNERLLRVAVDPTGHWVAFSDNTNSLLIYDTRTMRKKVMIHRSVDEMVPSADGRTLYVASPAAKPGGDEVLEALDVVTGQVRWQSYGGPGEAAFSLSPDGKVLVLGSNPTKETAFGSQPLAKNATLTFFRVADGSPARTPIQLGLRRGGNFAGNRHVAVLRHDTVEFLDTRTGRITGRVAAPGQQGVAISPDGSTIAAVRADGTVRVTQVRSGHTTILRPPGGQNESPNIKFSPDGRTLTAAGADGSVVTWDLATRQSTEWHGQTGPVTGIAFSSDGRTLWTDGLDGTAVEFDLTGNRGLRTSFETGSQPAPDETVPYVSVSPDGHTLAERLGGQDHLTRFLDATTFRQLGTLPKGTWQCCGPPAFDPRGDVVATVSGTTVDLWDVASGTHSRTLYTSPTSWDPSSPVHPPVDTAAMSPDGRTVVTNDGNTVLLVDTDSGRIERKFSAGHYAAWETFSPRGSLLAVSTTNSLEMRDPATGKELWRQKVPSQSAIPAFSPDGRLVATGDSNGQVWVFGARSGRQITKPYIGDAGYLFSLSFNPRTGLLASTGTDGVATISDPRTGQIFGSPLADPEPSWAMGTWDSTGSRYILIDSAARGYAWDMSVTGWEARACSMAGRVLTRDEWRQFLPDRPYRPAC